MTNNAIKKTLRPFGNVYQLITTVAGTEKPSNKTPRSASGHPNPGAAQRCQGHNVLLNTYTKQDRDLIPFLLTVVVGPSMSEGEKHEL